MEKKLYTPRLQRPEAGNKYYITRKSGGYSWATKGSPVDADCDVLHNCVGYAYGRFNEIIGEKACNYLQPCNAELFIQYMNDGIGKETLVSGSTPKLGAVVVWQKGATLSGSDGAGHVAIVEKIIDENTIVTSESGWNARSAFWTQTRKKGSNGNWGQDTSYKFLGFIYQPCEYYVEEPEPIEPSTEFAIGEVVGIIEGAKWVTGQAVPTAIVEDKWIIKSFYNEGHTEVIIDANADGTKHGICSAIETKYLTHITEEQPKPDGSQSEPKEKPKPRDDGSDEPKPEEPIDEPKPVESTEPTETTEPEPEQPIDEPEPTEPSQPEVPTEEPKKGWFARIIDWFIGLFSIIFKK